MSASVPSPKPAINLSKLRYILATDCGSTTTKAILIEKVGSSWRQTQRAEAPTTVEEPFANVTIGVSNSLTEIGELAGRRFIAEDGTIIRRKDESDPAGCDLYISTSSAGGGLQMVVAGVVAQMTAASAKRAALGAGAIVMDTIASNDKRRPHERICGAGEGWHRAARARGQGGSRPHQRHAPHVRRRCALRGRLHATRRCRDRRRLHGHRCVPRERWPARFAHP